MSPGVLDAMLEGCVCPHRERARARASRLAPRSFGRIKEQLSGV